MENTGPTNQQSEVIIQLRRVTGRLLQMLSSLSPDMLNTVPFDGSWTAGQVGEHLLKSYSVADTLKGTTKPTQRSVDENFQEIKKLFLNYDIKMEAPEFIVPSEDWIDKKKLVSGLKEKVRSIITFAENNNLSPTCLDFELPGYGPLTRLEWLYFVTVHTQRHLHQLDAILEYYED